MVCLCYNIQAITTQISYKIGVLAGKPPMLFMNSQYHPVSRPRNIAALRIQESPQERIH